MNRVILVLEYDMGDYSDMKEERGTIPTTPSYWFDSFFQSDALISDMQIKSVRIEIDPPEAE